MRGSQSNPLITNLSTCHKAPKWSLPGKAKDGSDKKNVPGPGAYSASNPDLNKYRQSPRFGFGTSQRAASNATGVPGPGQYTPHAADASPAGAIKDGFGSSARMGQRPMSSPGPGAYESHGSIGNSSPKYSAAMRTNQVSGGAGATPGPGAYQPSKLSTSKVRTEPKWGFGTSPRDASKGTGVPGPGMYNDSGSLAGPRYTMGSKCGRNKVNNNPGPGAYGAPYTQFG